ncbi:hypothetical protein BU17DRAFT_100591 [Hysterangium stoloniferum]|nr:hypothetical protein BU17DRAFT_100591 [Hysterangium stoloniferum]
MFHIEFSSNIYRIKKWCERMGFELWAPKQLTEPYAWCQTHFLTLQDRLVDFYGFNHTNPSDDRMLFAVAFDPQAQRARGMQSLPIPTGRIELPLDASSFFSPERRQQWRDAFHGGVWDGLDPVGIPGSNTFLDIIYLLQCLIPGMFLFVERNDGWSMQRGIPPKDWIYENKNVLISSIGEGRYERLANAASDPSLAVIDSRYM